MRVILIAMIINQVKVIQAEHDLWYWIGRSAQEVRQVHAMWCIEQPLHVNLCTSYHDIACFHVCRKSWLCTLNCGVYPDLQPLKTNQYQNILQQRSSLSIHKTDKLVYAELTLEILSLAEARGRRRQGVAQQACGWIGTGACFRKSSAFLPELDFRLGRWIRSAPVEICATYLMLQSTLVLSTMY